MTEAVAGSGREFDVEAFIDRRKVGMREIVVLLIVCLVLFLDGFDMYFLGKILPAIAEGLGGQSIDMQPVVSYQQIGMAVGAFIMPPLADRIGRKPVLLLCLLVFGSLTLWAAYADSFTMMAWLRGISGVFFSAMLPVGLALISETTPRHRRALFMSIALVCFSGGNLGSGVMVKWLLVDHGWQIFFVIGGIIPLLAMLMLLAVPESIAFRVNRNPHDPRIPGMLQQMDSRLSFTGDERFFMGGQAQVERLGPLAMFGPRFRMQTILLWCICFFSLGNIALMANWLATYMLEMRDLPLDVFAGYMIIGYFGGAAGTLAMGWLMGKTNPYMLLAIYFVMDAVAIGSLGFVSPASLGLFLGVLIAWNFCQVGGQTGINNISSLGYPPEMRSSGMGWAGGIGRLGGIVFPFLGGEALQYALPLHTILLIAAVPALVIAALSLVLGAVNRGVIGGVAMQRPVPAG